MKLEIGNIIYGLRKSRKLTQEQLAIEIGISAAAVSKWENGNAMPDIGILCGLADYFNVSVDELLGRTNQDMDISKTYEYKAEAIELVKDILHLQSISRDQGLLAMEEELEKQHYQNEFLKFTVDYMLTSCQRGLVPDMIFSVIENYANAADVKDRLNYMLIAKGFRCILAGESVSITKEILCSCIGYDTRQLFYQTVDAYSVGNGKNTQQFDNQSDSIDEEKIKHKYENQSYYSEKTDLLEMMAEFDDALIQLILRNVDRDILVRALKGVSGKVLKKFIDNMSKRISIYILEDIDNWLGNEDDIIHAQRNMLEIYSAVYTKYKAQG